MIIGSVNAFREALIRLDSVETDPLLGMGLLYGYELTIEVVEAGNVSLRLLPNS